MVRIERKKNLFRNNLFRNITHYWIFLQNDGIEYYIYLLVMATIKKYFFEKKNKVSLMIFSF